MNQTANLYNCIVGNSKGIWWKFVTYNNLPISFQKQAAEKGNW